MAGFLIHGDAGDPAWRRYLQRIRRGIFFVHARLERRFFLHLLRLERASLWLVANKSLICKVNDTQIRCRARIVQFGRRHQFSMVIASWRSV
ncbi:MAG: hypothetical protein K2W93_09395 [Burkholderiaceae bacterium]|nr:hypothetical protein [Burkholderiaceae bacterium]